MTNHLVVFAKAPRLGRVKNRLAADIGRVNAWVFYRRTLDAVLRRLQGNGRWQSWLCVTPDDADGFPPGWTVVPQGPGDLGERMDRPLRLLPPGPAVIVGTDVPDISRNHIHRAFEALGPNDAVFGPAADGGYWLVGLRRRPNTPHLFAGVRWSTRHALTDTIANLPNGKSAYFLETLSDVDDARDLLKRGVP
ncbi:MAG: TIGR04282 family arsenosugar biosynthesis glycosyltransferase [Rhodospirillales bacterium]|nr:TIGR04282 family arsenosugar biosynthesis glycosyltransferase [Rhodospirillales bacterium]